MSSVILIRLLLIGFVSILFLAAKMKNDFIQDRKKLVEKAGLDIQVDPINIESHGLKEGLFTVESQSAFAKRLNAAARATKPEAYCKNVAEHLMRDIGEDETISTTEIQLLRKFGIAENIYQVSILYLRAIAVLHAIRFWEEHSGGGAEGTALKTAVLNFWKETGDINKQGEYHYKNFQLFITVYASAIKTPAALWPHSLNISPMAATFVWIVDYFQQLNEPPELVTLAPFADLYASKKLKAMLVHLESAFPAL